MNAAPRAKRILHVEDDDAHACVLHTVIVGSGRPVMVERARDAVEARAMLDEAEADPRRAPDLVVLDLKLPGSHGLDVLRRLRASPSLRLTPAVVLTTSDAGRDRLDAAEAQANSYLVKPLDFIELEQMIDEMLSYWLVWDRSRPAA